jgi:membrane protein DedA with SNARE-associated domain
MGWTLFTAMSAAGEAVWVVVYVGLGFAFAGQLEAVAGLLADSVGLLTSALLATLAGYALLRQGRRRRLRR